MHRESQVISSRRFVKMLNGLKRLKMNMRIDHVYIFEYSAKIAAPIWNEKAMSLLFWKVLCGHDNLFCLKEFATLLFCL